MTKSILLTTLAIAGLSFAADNAFAARRCCRTHQSACGCAATCCTPTPSCCNATAMAAPAPATAQAGGTNSYQSFSYEPGSSAPANPVIAPVYQTRRGTTSFYDQIRGDRKARGLY
jgi:hypothetical protein